MTTTTAATAKFKRQAYPILANPRYRYAEHFPASNHRYGLTLGPFGIHKEWKTYTITHLASGLKIAESIQMLAWAKHEVQCLIAWGKAHAVDWNHENPIGQLSGDVQSELRQALRKWEKGIE